MSSQLPDGKLYDLTMIREIAHGNNDFVKKMMSLFIDTMPPAISELKQHLSERNWTALGAIAHKIKPSIDTMGIVSLKEDIRAMERNGKEMSNLDELPELMNKVDAVIQRVIDDLHAELAEG
jgi:HPt (histidine-containing phosphotransfer) domain-containing protein